MVAWRASGNGVLLRPIYHFVPGGVVFGGCEQATLPLKLITGLQGVYRLTANVGEPLVGRLQRWQGRRAVVVLC